MCMHQPLRFFKAVYTNGNVVRLHNIDKDFRLRLTALICIKDFLAAIIYNRFFQNFHKNELSEV